MLSRVADSLYWMSRYLERAEHTARVLEVNLYGRLDQRPDATGRRWALVLRSLSVRPPEGETLDPQRVVDHLAFDRAEPHSILSCIVAARQNAREVREHISSEMWEQINRLYLEAMRTRPSDVSDARTYEFFQAMRQGAHLFQGITATTMSRGDGWYFIQLGRFLERVSATVVLLDAHLGEYQRQVAEGDVAADQYLEWAGLLKSCTALEAYCRVHTANILPEKGAAFLLLDPDFPHSVRFGVEMVRGSLDALAGSIPALKQSDVHRRLGKLLSALSFDLIEEIVARDVHAFLTEVRDRCGEVHDAVYLACITYPVDLALTA